MSSANVLDAMMADPSILAGVDIDKEYGDQCWDLVELYAQRRGVPKEPWAIPLGPTLSAKEAWTYYGQNAHMKQYFNQIPAGQQQKGDIMVYDGHGIYTEGHIAINSRGGNWIFEQNADPDGSLPHEYNRAPTYLLGALRIKDFKGDDVYEGRSAEDWAAQAKDAQRYKDQVVESLSWKKIPGQIGGGMNENPDNIRYVIDNLEQFKADTQAKGVKVTKQDVIDYINGNLK